MWRFMHPQAPGILSKVLLLAGIAGSVAACTAARPPDPILITATSNTLTHPPPNMLHTSNPTTTPFPPLRSDLGDYQDRSDLLAEICFDFLLSQVDSTWVWQTQTDVDAFFAQVNDSELCQDPISSPEIDFNDQQLAGIIVSTTGCDAAFTFERLEEVAEARLLLLVLNLRIRTGCTYDLVEPLLVVLPAPPDGYQVRLTLIENTN